MIARNATVEAKRREIGDRRVSIGPFGPSRVALLFGRSPLHGYSLFAGTSIPMDAEILWPQGPGYGWPAEEARRFGSVGADFNFGIEPEVPDEKRGETAVSWDLSFDTPRGNVRIVLYVDPAKRRTMAKRCFADRDIVEGEELLAIQPGTIVEVSSINIDGRWFMDVEAERCAWVSPPQDPSEGTFLSSSEEEET